MGYSGAASAAWLLVPFAIGLGLLPFEDTFLFDEGWKGTLYEWLFNGAWILGLLGALVMPTFTLVAGIKLKAPALSIPIAVVLALLAYGALSYVALLGLEQFYFPDDGLGFD